MLPFLSGERCGNLKPRWERVRASTHRALACIVRASLHTKERGVSMEPLMIAFLLGVLVGRCDWTITPRDKGE